MMFSSAKRRLAITVMSVLLITMAASMTMVSRTVHAQPAKNGPISIRSVWTSDENQNSKKTFAPVDWIYYHADFDNNTGGQLKVDVEEEIIPNDLPWGGGYSYHNTFSIQVASGLTRLYTPEKVPPTAVTGSFSIRISIAPSDSPDPANDGDWGEGDFSVYSSTNIFDVNKRIKALQNAAMCLGDAVSYGTDDLLLESVKTGAEMQAFFQDEQTSAWYVGYVNLFKGSCVEVLQKLVQQGNASRGSTIQDALPFDNQKWVHPQLK
jgi:hypothetical protein